MRSNKRRVGEIFMFTRKSGERRGRGERGEGGDVASFPAAFFPSSGIQRFGRHLLLLDFFPPHLGRTRQPVLVSGDSGTANPWLEPKTGLAVSRKSRP